MRRRKPNSANRNEGAQMFYSWLGREVVHSKVLIKGRMSYVFCIGFEKRVEDHH